MTELGIKELIELFISPNTGSPTLVVWYTMFTENKTEKKKCRQLFQIEKTRSKASLNLTPKNPPYYVKGVPSHFLQENVLTLKEAIPQLMPLG